MAADAKRLAATDLLGRLFSQPGSADILREYSDLYGSMLSRLHDQKVREQEWAGIGGVLSGRECLA